MDAESDLRAAYARLPTDHSAGSAGTATTAVCSPARSLRLHHTSLPSLREEAASDETTATTTPPPVESVITERVGDRDPRGQAKGTDTGIGGTADRRGRRRRPAASGRRGR